MVAEAAPDLVKLIAKLGTRIARVENRLAYRNDDSTRTFEAAKSALEEARKATEDISSLRYSVGAEIRTNVDMRTLLMKHALTATMMRLKWLMEHPETSAEDVASVYEAMARDIDEELSGVSKG